MFTYEERQIIDSGKKAGKSKEEVLAELARHHITAKTGQASKQDAPTFANDLKETGQDAMQTLGGFGSQFGKALEGSKAIIKDKELNPVQKFMGVSGKVLGGVSGTIGEIVTGAGKMALSKESEAKLKSITESLGKGVAQSDVAKGVIDDWYGGLDKNDKLFVDSVGGVVSFMADVYAPGAVKAVSKPVVEGVETGVKAGVETLQTGVKATAKLAEPIVDVARGAADTASGLKTQVADYGARVVNQAKDTAAESRRLATLPPSESKLIRTGIDEGGMKVIKESTPSERSVYRELVDSAKTKTANPLAAAPKEIAGREFMKPVDYLLKVRNSVGAKLGAVRGKLSNAPVDVTPQFKQFQSYLNNTLGVYVDGTGKFVTTRGKIAPSDLKELQKLYNELRPDKTGKVMRSQKWIDEWSQRTFKEYDLRQSREMTFSDDVTRTVEQARNIFKGAMPKEYVTLSTQYAGAMKPIQDVVKLLGYTGDITKLSAKELKAAEVALRVLGNASDRPQSVIDSVLKTATGFGYKSDVDLNKILYVTDALEDIYPKITPKRGFSGSTARGINQAEGAGAISDVATGNITGILNRAVNSGATEKEIQDAFEAFINSLDEAN